MIYQPSGNNAMVTLHWSLYDIFPNLVASSLALALVVMGVVTAVTRRHGLLVCIVSCMSQPLRMIRRYVHMQINLSHSHGFTIKLQPPLQYAWLVSLFCITINSEDCWGIFFRTDILAVLSFLSDLLSFCGLRFWLLFSVFIGWPSGISSPWTSFQSSKLLQDLDMVLYEYSYI